MRKYLNGTNTNLNDNLYGTGKLTKAFEDSIKQVNKNCYGSDCSDRLWLLSEMEIRGESVYCTTKEGSQYKFYVGKSFSSTTKYWNGSATSYWLRSPQTTRNHDGFLHCGFIADMGFVLVLMRRKSRLAFVSNSFGLT